MLRRCVLMAAIAILITGGTAFAQNQGRTVKVEATNEARWSVGQCGTAEIVQWSNISMQETLRYDKSGRLVEELYHYKAIRPSIYYLSDPSDLLVPIPNTKSLMGSAGQNETDRHDVINDLWYGSGNLLQITVPGYGRIFTENGHMGGYPFVNRGHNNLLEADVAALCDYLSGR